MLGDGDNVLEAKKNNTSENGTRCESFESGSVVSFQRYQCNVWLNIVGDLCHICVAVARLQMSGTETCVLARLTETWPIVKLFETPA